MVVKVNYGLLEKEVRKKYGSIRSFLGNTKTGNKSRLDGTTSNTLSESNFYRYRKTGYLPEKYLDKICRELNLSPYYFTAKPAFSYNPRETYEEYKGKDLDQMFIEWFGFYPDETLLIPVEEKEHFRAMFRKYRRYLEDTYLHQTPSV